MLLASYDDVGHKEDSNRAHTASGAPIWHAWSALTQHISTGICFKWIVYSIARFSCRQSYCAFQRENYFQAFHFYGT